MKFDTDNPKKYISDLHCHIYHFSLITNYFCNLSLVIAVHELIWKLEATPYRRLFCITTTEAQAHLLHHRAHSNALWKQQTAAADARRAPKMKQTKQQNTFVLLSDLIIDHQWDEMHVHTPSHRTTQRSSKFLWKKKQIASVSLSHSPSKFDFFLNHS